MAEQKNNKNKSAYNQEDNQYEETFYILPRRIRQLEGMTLTYLDFYETCFQFWNKGKSCFLSNGIIKQRTGIKSDSRINEAFQYFEKHNVLKREYKNGKRYITPIFTDIETDAGVSPEREGGIATARGGVSPERDINKEVLNKEINIKEKEINKEKEIVIDEVQEVIEKAQECLENTKANLPIKAGTVKKTRYQETNYLVTSKPNGLPALNQLNTLSFPKEILEKLIDIRKHKKASNNFHALKAVYEELVILNNQGYDLDKAIGVYANNNWTGFNAEWIINAMYKDNKKSSQDRHAHDWSTDWIQGCNLPEQTKD